MQPTLRVRMMDAKPLVWWYAHRNEIDMDPPYQRKGDVWSTDKKAFLIDSIINEFDVPKFYLADFYYGDSALNRKKLPYAIIDGKQRFQAIFQFFEDQFSLSEDFIYLRDPSQKLAGKKYSELRSNYPNISEIIDTYNLSVMSVLTKSTKLINDLFVRLNSSQTSLTGAEIRNAMPGEAVEAVKEISNHKFFLHNISFSTKRRSDFDVASKILLFEYAGKPVATKKTNLDEFVITSIRTESGLELIKRGKKTALDILCKMHSIFDRKDRLLRYSNVIPVYYWLVRGIEFTSYSNVRSFLLNVEFLRNEIYSVINSTGAPEDFYLQLLEYINYYSRLNDAVSNEGRYRLLNDWFNNDRDLLDSIVNELKSYPDSNL